ncbi:MAG: AAA family ATPase [Campylobacterota bacterium]|nr:AAA family ATPase [Campylobacterota bacterium]
MKLKVKNIAKIDEADVEIKDLTVFVGKNSTNKSYMAHTVYMVNKILSKFDDSTYRFSNFSSKIFNEYLKDTITKDDIQLLETLETFSTVKQHQIQTGEDDYEFEDVREVIFDFSSTNLDNIILNIENFIFKQIVELVNQSFNVSRTILKNIIFDNYRNTTKELLKDNKIIITNEDKKTDHIVVLSKIFRKNIADFFQQKIAKKEFYFPASRTGFVLAFDEIVSGVLRDRFGGQPTATKLTEPTIDFISGFSDIKSGKFNDEIMYSFWRNEDQSSKQKMKKLFGFIEDRIVKGKIVEDKTSQNYTHFYLQTSNREKLDLHLSSSATVELLPLVIFLKHFSTIDDRLLVIEEPEAHLHPKAQIEMARLLVMLSNAGAKVLITTHSDYILNELSNCIKLDKATDEKRTEYLKKYKLDKDTIISADRVSAYLFKDIDSKKTEVKELTIDEYGIANDNFDDILDELLERTGEINEMVL